MKYQKLIGGIGVFLLLAGVFFLIFRDKPAQEGDIFPEGPLEESDSKEGESSAQVLEDMPKQPDFRSITETIFLNEGVEEAKSFEMRAITPLEELQQKGKETKVLLENKETNWCAPLLTLPFASSSEPGIPNDEYQGVLQEEREVRDVKFLSQAVQAGDEWSFWLVRLMEAVNREDKKKEKAVEKFQDSFNEITDEYEETLYHSAGTAREKIDGIIFSEKDIASLPTQLFQELNNSFGEKLLACREGRALEVDEYATLSRSLTPWENKVADALSRRKGMMDRILDIPPAVTATLAPQTKDYTTRFEAAIVELQQSLP